MRSCSTGGFTIAELLVASTVSLLIFSVVLATYVQTENLMGNIEAAAKVQGNLRVAMDRIERDLRMLGYGVPEGPQVGGTALWTPVIFSATPSQIGFRAELDSGNAEIVCTPRSTNSDCPRTKLRLDRIDYYQDLNCSPPDGSGGSLALVAALNIGGGWQPLTCSGFSTTDSSITVSIVDNGTFLGGASTAYTIEQVYLRYTALATPPYGAVTRHVRYANTPDSSFPPSGVTWTTIASGITDFWFEYRDGAGTILSGSSLTQAQREAVARIVLIMEGFEEVGASGSQVVRMRSEIVVRNAS